MIACSTGLDWIATKSAIVTGFFACGAAPAPPPSTAATTRASASTRPAASDLLPNERRELTFTELPPLRRARKFLSAVPPLLA